MEATGPILTYDRLTEADLDAVASLEALCFTLPWSKALFAEELKHPDLSTWVLAWSPSSSDDGSLRRREPGEGGRALVAYMGTWKAGDECHLVNLAVHPDWRRKGVARGLAAHLLGLAKARGCVRATLEVRASNSGAIRLYEGMGFETIALRKAYYSDNQEDALIMWKNAL